MGLYMLIFYGRVWVEDLKDCLISVFNKMVKVWTRFSTPMFGDFYFLLCKHQYRELQQKISQHLYSS